MEAYFDESGTHSGSKVTVVAGGLSDKSSWLDTTRGWENILKRFGVNNFHATDLNSFKREFANWDESKRRLFYQELLNQIKGRPIQMLGIGIQNDVYTEVSKRFEGSDITPYQFCATWCVHEAAHFASKNYNETVDIVFERGQNKPHSPQISFLIEERKISKRFNVNSITYKEKLFSTPLQIADLVAYEFYKEGCFRATEDIRNRRHPLEFIAENMTEPLGGMLTEKAIHGFLRILSSPSRRRFRDKNT